MNFLVLLNGADGYKTFFSSLGQALESSGHKVRFAIDSHYPDILEPNEYSEEKTAYFSDFFREHQDFWFQKAEELCQDPESPLPSWGEVFYSDFERFHCFGYSQVPEPTYWQVVYTALQHFFANQVELHEIDAIIYENVSNSFAYMAWAAAKDKGIPYLGLMPARIPNHFELQTTIWNENERVNQIRQEITQESAEETEWIDNYLNQLVDSEPDYMKTNKLDALSITGKYLNRRKLGKLVRILKAQILLRKERSWSYLSATPARTSWAMIKRTIARRIRDLVIRRYFETPTDNTPYYVYPIHFHPESSTSVLAPEFTNELHNIQNIANALPINSILYVKDHKSAYGLQSISFYRKVKNTPNVRLIEPQANIKRLIKNSEGVITITGTAGLEAHLLGKPAWCLGAVCYQNFPAVKRVSSFTQLKEALSHPSLNHPTTLEIRYSLLAYKRYTLNGKLNLLAPPNWDVCQNITSFITKNSQN